MLMVKLLMMLEFERKEGESRAVDFGFLLVRFLGFSLSSFIVNGFFSLSILFFFVS